MGRSVLRPYMFVLVDELRQYATAGRGKPRPYKESYQAERAKLGKKVPPSRTLRTASTKSWPARDFAT